MVINARTYEYYCLLEYLIIADAGARREEEEFVHVEASHASGPHYFPG